jgi:[ribosomal protein S5]-alanine N-acetyltransferase
VVARLLGGKRRAKLDPTVSEPNVIETERLALRRLTLNDLDALAAIYSDEDVRQYFPEGILTYEQTKEELEWIINVYYGQYGFGLWATTLKETNEFIGRCGLLPWTIDGREEVEVAYLLAKEHWGRGLGTEAARAILAYGFEELHLSRLICLIDPANEASVKVAVKIGMSLEREAEIDGEPTLVSQRTHPPEPSRRRRPERGCGGSCPVVEGGVELACANVSR